MITPDRRDLFAESEKWHRRPMRPELLSALELVQGARATLRQLWQSDADADRRTAIEMVLRLLDRPSAALAELAQCAPEGR